MSIFTDNLDYRKSDPWIHIEEQAPPFDEAVLVEYLRTVINPEGNPIVLTKQCIAFNEVHPPKMCMTAINIGRNEYGSTYESFVSIPGDIIRWMRIPA